MANSYPTGSNVRFSAEFKDPGSGAFVDPTTVTFKIKSPMTGVVTTYTLPAGPQVVRDSLGHFHCDFTLNFPGNWYYRWEGAGAYIGAAEYYCCAMDTVF